MSAKCPHPRSARRPEAGMSEAAALGGQITDPTAPAAVAASLLTYLGDRLGVTGLQYSAPPCPLPDGWETHLFRFCLRGPNLPPGWDRPLVLRIHANGRGRLRARHEFEVPRHLAGLGYPVPEPLLVDEVTGVFGGPFLIMEQVPGSVLLRAALRRPWRPFLFPELMAEVHARLHALPTDGFPAPPGAFLDRHLAALRSAIARHDLAGLGPGLDWLEAHQPPEAVPPSILHLDFHPLNLIVRPDDKLVVLDWTYADVGDPHADVATTLTFLRCFPIELRTGWERLAVTVGRPLVSGWYEHAYRRRRPLDRTRLDYYRAWAVLDHLVRYGGGLRDGPEAIDCKPSLARHLSPGLFAVLCRCFRQWTGVDVSL
jgi:aminoglycoside phosphotransferase (APT) family kinase protein